MEVDEKNKLMLSIQIYLQIIITSTENQRNLEIISNEFRVESLLSL